MLSAEAIKEKLYKNDEHPYRLYERKITSTLRKSDVLLDAGCGRSAPILRRFVGKADMLIGVDLEESINIKEEITYIKGDISNIDLENESVDVVISRAVLEHIKNPKDVFEEINRILKPGGSFIFLVPNLGDYVSIISLLIPRRFHGFIISKIEDRNVEDVFPSYYKANTYSSIKKLSKSSGFTIKEFQWLTQYPDFFMFNSILFLIASVYEKIINKIRILRFLRNWLLVHLVK